MISTKPASDTASTSSMAPPDREDEAHSASSVRSHARTLPVVSEDLPAFGNRRRAGRSQSDESVPRMPHRPAVLPRAVSDPSLYHPSSDSVQEVETASMSTAAHMLSVEGSQPAPGSSSARREALLADYHTAIHRPLDLGSALAAIQLRRAAEIYCEKNNLARFAPRPPRTRAAERRIGELMAKPVEALIAEVQAHPNRFSRTELTDVAQRHLQAALNIDDALWRKGIHQAGLYEGLHTMAGRLVNVAAASISAGLSEIPGVKTAASSAMKVAKKSIRILSHELPPNVINPVLTGRLRSVTDVKQSFKRVGGLPVVAVQIEKSPDMGAIVRAAREKRHQLDQAIGHFTRIQPNDPAALGRMVDAFLALHNVADRQYRRRVGLNRTQTYSKGWGMAVNGVMATGAVVTATVPAVGQIAGPAILAATVPLQWGAGYLDERRSKHRYNLRANTKWADFLRDDAARLHFKSLTIEHVSEAALRRSFMTQPEVQVAAIREVYDDAIGELVRQHAGLVKKLESRHSTATPAHTLALQRELLWELEHQLDVAKTHAHHFESFDLERWRSIPADSLIGRCLDDLGQLEKANRHARLRKPGEGAQTVQRYVQAFHGGVSTGTSLPIVDTITSVDAFYAPEQHGNAPAALLPGPEAAAIGAGVVGGAVFTAATGEVRMTKADNKKSMAKLRISPETYEADAADWVFKAGNRDVDLRTSAGYRQHVHTTRDELALVGQALKHGLTSGPVGLANLLRARGQLRQARASMDAALDALAESGLPRQAPQGSRAPTIAAMLDELYDYPAVRNHLGVL